MPAATSHWRQWHVHTIAVDLMADAEHLVHAVIPLVSRETQRADDAILTVLDGLEQIGHAEAFGHVERPGREDEQIDITVRPVIAACLGAIQHDPFDGQMLREGARRFQHSSPIAGRQLQGFKISGWLFNLCMP